MKLMGLALVVFVLAASPVAYSASNVLLNESGQPARGLLLEFTEAVNISGAGDVLTTVSQAGSSSRFLFVGGEIAPEGGTHWVTWSPETAVIARYTWIHADPNGYTLDGLVFPDPNLELAVRHAVELPRGELIPRALQSLKHLRLLGLGIASLEGLQHCTGLEEILLGPQWTQVDEQWRVASRNFIEDLTPLCRLTQLSRLEVSFNRIVDIGPLAGLVNLVWLCTGWNHIVDLGPLAGLTSLVDLDLGPNDVEDVSPLADLVGLRRLSVDKNRIEDIGSLGGLRDLRDLELGENKIRDISALCAITGLTRLELQVNHVSDVSCLARLTDLESVSLANNEIVDIEPLKGLTELKQLSVEGNRLLLGTSSTAMQVIEVLLARGVEVRYEPQG